jgi:signal transduction histidine kinase
MFLFYVGTSQTSNRRSDLDSINFLINLSNKNSIKLNKSLYYAQISSELSYKVGIDSIILKSNRNFSLWLYNNDKYEDYKEINHKNLKLALKLQDSSAMAVANHNLALYHRDETLNNDSAFFYYSRALKFYNKLNNTYKKAEVLTNIANIQKVGKDYLGGESNAIDALKLLNGLESTEIIKDDIWILHNMIGNISSDLKNYKKSLEYHSKAIDIANDMKDGDFNKTISFNNQASVYRSLENYEKALELYYELIELREVYEEYDPTFYPLIVDNIAYTKIQAGHDDYREIGKMFYEAYDISKVLEDDVTRLAVTIDLSKYYKHLNVKDSTLKYAENAYVLAKRISSNDIFLESMILLSELNEGNKGKSYLKEHIKLTDSLLQVERNVRNRNARIEFDTDQIEAKNEQISRENLYLLILSIGLLFSAILIYVVISQRAKNRKLKLIQVQQKANEDIYNLMLGQQDKVDEARAKEKIRVSKELHDGVLGRLFGTRLSLDSMNFQDGKEAMMTRANYIGQLKTIEEDIRKISHELNTDFVSGTGFMDIVSELIENQTQAYGLKYEYDYTDDISWDMVTNKTKINIYRIIQESMQNIYKHANAKAIKISISLEKDVICLDIIDDGDGFDTSKSKKGIGLKNMTSRVEDINGKINFTSQSGNGTTVNVKIPYTDQST